MLAVTHVEEPLLRWNPIGAPPVECRPPDKHDSCAPNDVSLLSAGTSAMNLSIHLGHDRTVTIDLSADRTRGTKQRSWRLGGVTVKGDRNYPTSPLRRCLRWPQVGYRRADTCRPGDAKMRLADLEATHECFLQLERYVNIGSPSGFSFLNTPGPGFRANDLVDRFDVPVFDCRALSAVNAGASPSLGLGHLPIHPEMAGEYQAASGTRPIHTVHAAPTSSGRTLSVSASSGQFFVKVAYQRLLGRLTRRMTRAHVLSAIEVSSAYESAIAARRLPDSFRIYRERSGLYFDTSALQSWGYVEREIAPYPNGHFIEVPAFSLIARPSGEALSLLEELVDANVTLATIEGYFTFFLQPLIDLYFSSVRVLGLQPEAHAQNVVFLLSEARLPTGVALRDMESVDKDMPLMEACGVTQRFTPTGYKFLHAEDYNYQIMHSFMYDFKFGTYLLAPLVDAWVAYTRCSSAANLDEKIRRYAQTHLRSLPEDFFPDNVWYDYDKIVHEGSGKREYRKHAAPRFR